MLRRSLVGDVRARVARADDEHRPVLELGEVPVVVGVELSHPRIELRREARHVRLLHDTRRDDDVVGQEPPVADVGARSGRRPSSARRRHAPSAPEARSARRTTRGSPPSRASSGTRLRSAGKRMPGKPVVARRRVQPERVPALPPRVADALARVEDHERPTLLRQVVAGREPGLTAADDHGVERSPVAIVVPPRRLSRRYDAGDRRDIAAIAPMSASTRGGHSDHRELRRGRARTRTPSPPPARRRRASRRCSDVPLDGALADDERGRDLAVACPPRPRVAAPPAPEAMSPCASPALAANRASIRASRRAARTRRGPHRARCRRVLVTERAAGLADQYPRPGDLVRSVELVPDARPGGARERGRRVPPRQGERAPRLRDHRVEHRALDPGRDLLELGGTRVARPRARPTASMISTKAGSRRSALDAARRRRSARRIAARAASARPAPGAAGPAPAAAPSRTARLAVGRLGRGELALKPEQLALPVAGEAGARGSRSRRSVRRRGAPPPPHPARRRRAGGSRPGARGSGR